MTNVLAMLELDGPTEALLAAAGRFEALLETPAGVRARVIAPTGSGIVLWQLWESAQARERNAQDPAHSEALRASGLLALVTGTRARTFVGVTFEVFA